ncbi:sugar phosphate isomerase/epimerase [Pedobacter antarcticus]|uniref:sugar phosphate isomerase/epimerase family protein n=1 Tax=Pedobacter antarcticus TaxID=34086 RepID=UPI00292D8E2A|nr:sugar phosphate isomerase/epimerase [Pedobacter antarcticus]
MDNRRSFLKKAGLLGTATVLATPLFSEAMDLFSPVRKVQEIGLQLYTLRDQLSKDPKGTIGKVAEIGYNHVETFYNYRAGAPVDLWGQNAAEFSALLKSKGLKTYSGHYQLNDFLSPGKGDDTALKAQLEIASALGQQYFVVPVPPMGSNLDKMTSTDFKFMAAQLNKAGELSARSKIKMGYHNHFWEFRTLENGEKGYDILLKETDPALVSFEMDLFWIEKSGVSPDAYFKKYPGRFAMWHVKDVDKANTAKITGGKLDTTSSMEVLKGISYTEVGTGSVNFKEIFTHQQQAGLKHIFVEQDIIKIDPFLSIRDSYNFVKKNLV